MNRFGQILGSGWRRARQQAGMLLAGTGLFVLAFLAGSHLFFPTAAVQQWLSAQLAGRAGISLQPARMSLQPLFVLDGEQVVITYDRQQLVLDRLQLAPAWGTLLGGDPGLTVTAAALQGRVDMQIRRSGGLALQAAGLTLTDLPVHRETRTLLSGQLVRAELQGSFPARSGREARLALQLDNGTLTVMGQRLALGRIVIEGSGPANTLRLATLSASGGDVAISGSGTLLLGASGAASRLNLDLIVRPAPSAPPTLTALLDMVAQRKGDGAYALSLNGPPDRLTFN